MIRVPVPLRMFTEFGTQSLQNRLKLNQSTYLILLQKLVYKLSTFKIHIIHFYGLHKKRKNLLF